MGSNPTPDTKNYVFFGKRSVDKKTARRRKAGEKPKWKGESLKKVEKRYTAKSHWWEPSAKFPDKTPLSPVANIFIVEVFGVRVLRTDRRRDYVRWFAKRGSGWLQD